MRLFSDFDHFHQGHFKSFSILRLYRQTLRIKCEEQYWPRSRTSDICSPVRVPPSAGQGPRLHQTWNNKPCPQVGPPAWAPRVTLRGEDKRVPSCSVLELHVRVVLQNVPALEGSSGGPPGGSVVTAPGEGIRYSRVYGISPGPGGVWLPGQFWFQWLGVFAGCV